VTRSVFLDGGSFRKQVFLVSLYAVGCLVDGLWLIRCCCSSDLLCFWPNRSWEVLLLFLFLVSFLSRFASSSPACGYPTSFSVLFSFLFCLVSVTGSADWWWICLQLDWFVYLGSCYHGVEIGSYSLLMPKKARCVETPC